MRRARERGYLRRLGFGGSGVPCPCGKTLLLAQIVLVCPVIVTLRRTFADRFGASIYPLFQNIRFRKRPLHVIDAISQSHVHAHVKSTEHRTTEYNPLGVGGVSQPRSCATMHQARARYVSPRVEASHSNQPRSAGGPCLALPDGHGPQMPPFLSKPTNAISCSHHTTCACTPVLVLALRAGAATAGASHG